MSTPLIFLIVWLILVCIGLIVPKVYLPLIKWQVHLFGRMFGFKVEPEPDRVIFRKMRLWYSFFLVFGLFTLSMVLTGKAK